MISLDILPTSLAAAGIEPPAAAMFDGVNLLPYLSGEESGRPHDVLFWRLGANSALRKGDWKLVKQAERGQGTLAFQLFDLGKDTSETTDLAGQRPEVVKELRAEYERLDARMLPPVWGAKRKKG